jgi:hypothetical protein
VDESLSRASIEVRRTRDLGHRHQAVRVGKRFEYLEGFFDRSDKE